ncbi:hypothetical protein K0028_12090 [Curtobacterium flaccumfaciens pv. flaccumfaciens]|jgi:hypothetical protein|uniref:DUF6121 family protein n=1 Tax=Curtobacterium flaccumfaciens TaxID=2035 RepID=UPI001266BFFF|nr:DUF6121 family protein [Curtobacterium flaccumfaciens]MBT1664290.1 hypothetical protein [Curtobacterium flaccumfaciens pv. flaccumfaciens]MCS6554332.1 DUF6121 family protein [Curtobacterium flaccumfaciens]QFS79137.1 hypothetical protein GBG65_05585 [Curtobacterium flaccumfaciens pv. flaccumfaciens]QYI96432.1 hypothetical protein K0028_12090 [Curtobacterium flaccumfaciens pv. flaccumfaciens]
MSRWLIATMTSVLFIALVIAVTGFEALLADVEVISQPDATPYLGPAMVVGGAVVVFLATAAGVRDGNPGVTALVAAATVYLVMLGVGAVGYALVRSDATELLVFPAGYALGPFVVGSVVVALLSVLGGITMARHQARTGGGAGAVGAARPDGPDERSGPNRTNAGEEPAGR